VPVTKENEMTLTTTYE